MKGFGEVMKRIETWLEEEGFTYSQAKGKQAQNTLFSYPVTLPSGIIITIFQPSNKKDSIAVSAGLLFGEEQRRRLSQKSNIERNEIFSEMRFKLASVDVDFRFEDGDLPRRLVIDHPIYYDALTKDRFFKAIRTVLKALSLVAWVLRQSL